jgi:hypothetical protein
MNDLKNYQWKNRLLLVFVPSPEDERYQQQLEHLGNEQELQERDLVLFHIFEQGGFAGENRLSKEDSKALRQQFAVEKQSFAVVLLGKDGTEKQRWQDTVEASKVFALIDAMPMRQAETR